MVPLVFFSLKQIFRRSLSFKVLTLLKIEGQLFGRMSFSLPEGWSDISSWLDFSGLLQSQAVFSLPQEICFPFVRLLAMKSITWLRCIFQVTLPHPLTALWKLINKYFVGRTLTLCKYPMIHQLLFYSRVYLYLKDWWIPILLWLLFIMITTFFDVWIVPCLARRSLCNLAVSFWHVPIILWSLPDFLVQQDILSLFCTFFDPKRSSGFLLVENGTCFEKECICSCAFSRMLLWQFLSAASLLIPSTCRGFTTSAPLPPSPRPASTQPILLLC